MIRTVDALTEFLLLAHHAIRGTSGADDVNEG